MRDKRLNDFDLVSHEYWTYEKLIERVWTRLTAVSGCWYLFSSNLMNSRGVSQKRERRDKDWLVCRSVRGRLSNQNGKTRNNVVLLPIRERLSSQSTRSADERQSSRTINLRQTHWIQNEKSMGHCNIFTSASCFSTVFRHDSSDCDQNKLRFRQ
jgi:hypothetical protein